MVYVRHLSRLATVLLSLVAGPAAAQILTNDQHQLHQPIAGGDQDRLGQSIADLGDLVTTIVRAHIPHTYEDKSKWGLTSERWDGLHIQLDRFQLKTKRRKKTVNHGDWEMYRIELVDPDQHLDVKVENLRSQDDGRVEFDTYFTAQVHAFGRVSKWVKGVQLYSFSSDARATMTLHTRGSVALVLDVTKLPPDVILDPQVSQADLRLDEFQLYRISDVGGEVAQQVGRGVRRILEDKMAESNLKLADKLNRQIEKKRDKLRLSLHDLAASKWAKWAEYVKKRSEGGSQ